MPLVWWLLAAGFAGVAAAGIGVYVGPVWGIGVAVGRMAVATGSSSAAVADHLSSLTAPGRSGGHRAGLHRRLPAPWTPTRPAAAPVSRPTPGPTWCCDRTSRPRWRSPWTIRPTRCRTGWSPAADPQAAGGGARPGSSRHYGWPGDPRDSRSTCPDVATSVRCSCCALDDGLAAPAYAHPGDAGADLRSAEDFELAPGERRLVGTGVAIALPDGVRGVRPPALRSCRPPRHHPGQRPGDRRRRLSRRDQGVPAQHRPRAPVRIARGDRIAQLVVQPVSRAWFVPVAELPDLGPRQWRPRVDRRDTERRHRHHPSRHRPGRWRDRVIFRRGRKQGRTGGRRRSRGRRDRRPSPAIGGRRGASRRGCAGRRRTIEAADAGRRRADELAALDDLRLARSGPWDIERGRRPREHREQAPDRPGQHHHDRRARLGAAAAGRRGDQGDRLGHADHRDRRRAPAGAKTAPTAYSSALELGAYARPAERRTVGGAARGDRRGATAEGGSASLIEGPFGVELRRLVPVTTPDGEQGYQPSRMWVAEGPRWLLRGIVYGQAAVEEDPDSPVVARRAVRIPERRRPPRRRGDGARRPAAAADARHGRGRRTRQLTAVRAGAMLGRQGRTTCLEPCRGSEG